MAQVARDPLHYRWSASDTVSSAVRPTNAPTSITRLTPVLPRNNEGRGTERPGDVHVHKDGIEKEYYPTHREELIEEALRKIACDRLNGVFLDDRAGVQVPLYELKKELKARGHSLNLPDIVDALKICNLASLSVEKSDGNALMQSTIFPVLLITSKQDWLQNPKKARCYVQFHHLVTASINQISYRQFDYLTYMTYKHRLSRWLHKRLSHNFTQASLMDPYTVRMSTVLRDSGTYSAPRGNNNAREIRNALDELVQKDILMNYKEKFIRGAHNKILDITYTLWPSVNFINEVKKANARVKKASAPSPHLPSPDNRKYGALARNS